jgi:hypothetical protein
MRHAAFRFNVARLWAERQGRDYIPAVDVLCGYRCSADIVNMKFALAQEPMAYIDTNLQRAWWKTIGGDAPVVLPLQGWKSGFHLLEEAVSSSCFFIRLKQILFFSNSKLQIAIYFE